MTCQGRTKYVSPSMSAQFLEIFLAIAQQEGLG